jgi:Flp pilus assembly protein TadG
MRVPAIAWTHLRGLHQNQNGSTILIFTLMFTVLLGFVAVVADAGVAYAHRRMLQNAVDSAALAGGAFLPYTPGISGPPINAAVAYANRNGVAINELITKAEDPVFGLQVTTQFNSGDKIVVSARRKITFGLRYIVGGSDVDIVATAQAVVVAGGPASLVPWAVPIESLSDCGIGNICTLRLAQSSDAYAGGGNFYALDYPGSSGATGMKDSIEYGWNGSVPYPSSGSPPPWDWAVKSEPGAKMGPTVQGVKSLFDLDEAMKCNQTATNQPLQDCSSLYQMDPTRGSSNTYSVYKASGGNGMVCYDDIRCPRVVIVPFIDSIFDFSGKKHVNVVDFGCFYVKNAISGGGQGDTGEIEGVFVQNCRNVGGSTSYGTGLDNKSTLVVLWQ